MLKLLLKSPNEFASASVKTDQAQKQEQPQTSVAKVKDQLPATGGEESATLALLGGLGLVLSAALSKRKRIKNSKKSYSIILDKT